MGYATDSQFNDSICIDRQTDKAAKKQASILKQWQFISGYPDGIGLCGNVRAGFDNKGKCKLGHDYRDENYISAQNQISSALAMYRINSMTEGKAMMGLEQQDFYKTTWSALLRHKETKQFLMLGEWKGGFQIFTEGHDVADLPPEFVKAAEEFLTFFVSNDVALGYDGTIAGTVA